MRRARGSIGQSTVEFALVLPLVVLLVLFVVQGGLIVRDQLLVSHAAREAARAAAVTDEDRGGAALRAARGAGGLDPGRLSGTVSVVDGGASVRASISYRSSTDLAFIGALVPDLDLDATVVMRIESVGQDRS